MVFALIIDGPLTPEFEARALLAHADQWRSLAHDGTIGATLRFEGVVRRAEREGAAPHRVEPRAAVADFIARLKQDVPSWKRAVWAG